MEVASKADVGEAVAAHKIKRTSAVASTAAERGTSNLLAGDLAGEQPERNPSRRVQAAAKAAKETKGIILSKEEEAKAAAAERTAAGRIGPENRAVARGCTPWRKARNNRSSRASQNRIWICSIWASWRSNPEESVAWYIMSPSY